MIDPLPIIALPKLFPYQPSHHTFDPLFSYDGILGGLQPRCIRVVYSIEGGRDFRLFREEEGGFWGWHGTAAADAAATYISADDV